MGRVPLVHFSTDYVFDGLGHRPWREDDRANPLSAYGASKLAGEEAVRAARGPHLIVRTSWVYAATGTNFLRTIARKAREWKELRIVADQFGAPTSARVIAEVVAGIVGASGAPIAERFAAAGGIVNVAASGETSWHGFAVAIVEGLKARNVKLAVESLTPIGTEDYPTKAKRPANSRLDLTRLQQVFGIDTMKWDVALQFELDLLAKEFTSLADHQYGWSVAFGLFRDRGWSKLAYQFGHELGHVTANSWQGNAKPARPRQWLEEAMVEALSLHGL